MSKTLQLRLMLCLMAAFISGSPGVDVWARKLQSNFPADTLQTARPGGFEPAPDRLYWLRGRVDSVSPDSITLKLGEGSFRLRLDDQTVIIIGNPSQKIISADELKVERQVGRPAVGAVVQAHYVNQHHVHRAVIIVDDGLSGEELSRKPGTSYLGVVEFADNYMGLYLRGRRSTHFTFRPNARFVDRTDHLLGTVGRFIASRLKLGESVLVLYKTESAGFGEGSSYGYFAEEIRRLGPEPDAR
jgi:hypothetical protein